MLSRARFQIPRLSERFCTTYNTDFKPISKRHPPLRPTSEAQSGLTMSKQLERKTPPMLYQHFYMKTNNDVSAVDCQPPSAFPSSCCSSVETRDADYRDKEVAGTGLSFGPKDEAQWQNVYGPRAIPLKQSADEPKPKTDVHYEEGVILFSPYSGPIGFEEFLQFLHREARPCQPLTLSVASSPVIRHSHNTETRENSWSSPFHHPSSGQRSHCDRRSEHPSSCCCGTQMVPSHACQTGFKPPAQSGAQTPPSRTLPLTEYQASYSAQWFQPNIRQN